MPQTPPISNDFSLPDQDGEVVALAATLDQAKGTVLLPFRGQW